jgi:hypothetical protein
MTKLLYFGKVLLVAFLLIGSIGLLAWKEQSESKQTIIWKLDHPELVGGFQTKILGAPKVVKEKTGSSLFFDGVDDGLIIPTNPVKGWKKFTVEVLFRPDSDGPTAPRFVHFEDTAGKRCTIEARITPAGMWYTDTFLKNGRAMKGLTLIDSTNLHPCDQWYWISLVYDGEKMTHYINGQKELEGITEFGPMDNGQISLGVRLNKVNWFKGRIKEVRFYQDALKEKELAH